LLAEVNFIAVTLATGVFLVLGLIFWGIERRVSTDSLEETTLATLLGTGVSIYLTGVFLAFVMAKIGADTLREGLLLGLCAGAILEFPLLFAYSMPPHAPTRTVFIMAGFMMLGCGIMGAIIGAF
jgi:hypothetical protein